MKTKIRTYQLTFALMILFVVSYLLKTTPHILYNIQSTVFSWAGDKKLFMNASGILNKSQLKDFKQQFHPGDIILTRCDGYISNFFIPGYWTHAALYIGESEERRQFFNVEIDGLATSQNNLIEALSEGVVCKTFIESAHIAAIAVLRPKINRTDISTAIENALLQVNKPYDFNFSFNSDSSIYCTELIYKAYLPYINFPIKKLFKHEYITANELFKYACLKEANGAKLELVFISNDRDQNLNYDIAKNHFNKFNNDHLTR